MRHHDLNAPRLFVASDLAPGVVIACDKAQVHYLRNVLRLGTGEVILIFNGRDGEWRARIGAGERSAASLRAEQQVRPQTAAPDIDYLFAPLKRARLDYMAQKATEMGVARLRPVFTRRTTAERINKERLRANAIEAAEQCGILRVPEVLEAQNLERVLGQWDPPRVLIFCDEDSDEPDPLATLDRVAPGPLGLLIGPEGGFDASERDLITSQPFAVRLSLGPRILRADTAAVAALALVNAKLGDWR
jgi:16S rRNA (uracil1498-N3)-methyltransferase